MWLRLSLTSACNICLAPEAGRLLSAASQLTGGLMLGGLMLGGLQPHQGSSTPGFSNFGPRGWDVRSLPALRHSAPSGAEGAFLLPQAAIHGCFLPVSDH
ncbi:Vacuolar membrane-associated protein iml1 [Dissostichus eleginoides]|uniref:Vacuolar membrane-associated protein iml1 n=1 Tax=Dissostichus eleginoides TaxID=100907 RepID=A0AAD9BI83_DISEL|nr:Vacuolar membrane-associated protein iml1 [Dissostichus eleginoides]